MAQGSPGCLLHMAFLLHVLAFASLLAGYCTPYWTVMKMSTGNVRSLGLVVSCDHLRGCDMLHVTRARVVFIVVFGMATGSVLLSLFALQVYCLALCNGSCRQRNMGACLSYFSMFLAFSVGGTLGLYQIDLQEEEKPDVMTSKIGWSRYALIGSAGGFLVGAWLSIADFARRHRLRRLRVLKEAEEAKTRLITVSEQIMKHRQQQQQRQADATIDNGNQEDPRSLPSEQNGRRPNPGVPPRNANPTSSKWTTAAAMSVTTANGRSQRRPRRMASTVQLAMRTMPPSSLGNVNASGSKGQSGNLSQEQQRQQTQPKSQQQQPKPREGGRDVNPGNTQGSRYITVDERSNKVKDPSSSNRGERQPSQSRVGRRRVDSESQLNSEDAMAEAAKKYKLTKSSHVDSMEERRSTLPSVEEEKYASGAGRRVADLGDRKKSLDASLSLNVPEAAVTPRARQTNAAVNDVRNGTRVEETKPKIVKSLVDEKQRRVTESAEADDNDGVNWPRGGPRDEFGLLEATGMGHDSRRRVSTVEEALKSVRSMLASIKETDATKTEEVTSKKKVSSAVTLDSNTDSVVPMTPIKQRLPSIEETMSERDRARQRKRLEKLESADSRNSSLDSKSVANEKDRGRAAEKESRSKTIVTQRSDCSEGKDEFSNSSTMVTGKERGKDSGDVLAFRKEATVDGRRVVDSNVGKDSRRNDDNKFEKSKSEEDRDRDNKQRSGQLESKLCLSEEQVKRNQIVEALANARRDKKKRRITQ